MVNWRQLQSRESTRERQVLWLGLGAILLGFYFLVIEPLEKKATAQQQIADTRLAQLSEMQRMASELLTNADTVTPRQLLQGKIATETLEDGNPLLKTKPLADSEAKQLLQQLAPHGKVAIYSTEDTLQTLWFWEKKRQ